MNHSNQSVSSLSEEVLKNIVQPMQVVDIHTHINGADPAAHDISEIIFYHYIVSELSAAGVSAETMKAAVAVEKKIALFLEWHGRISNTVTYWCLRRVLEQHGIAADVELTREVLSGANERVSATHGDTNWPWKALADNNRVAKTALTLNITEKIPSFDHKLFFGTLRLDDVTGNVTQEALRQFGAACGKSIGDLAAFENAAQECVENFARSGGRAVTLGVAPEEDYVPVERPVAEKLFARLLKGEALFSAEGAALHSYLLDRFAAVASDHHIPLQILIGVKRPLPGGAAVVIIHPGMVNRYAPLFHRFPALSFDLFLASAAHSQELISTAKNYPNITLSGCWWYAFSPPYIRAMLTERLLALPMVKLHAFFSDAYNVEWSTGKLALLRRELSRVLAELMVSGYLTESQAPEVAKALLSENATRLYRL